MPGITTGVDESLSKELEDLFNDDLEQNSPPATETDSSQNQNTDKDVGTTKAFAKRLKESTDKARVEEREAIAKSLGYNSYDELLKNKERQAISDKGYDPDELSPILDDLVTQRLNNDPRFKELELLKARQIEEFGVKELAEITKLTNGEITKLEQLDEDVLDLWKKKGSLKSAYLELKGEELIMKARSQQTKTTTTHMSSPSGTAAPASNKRPLTEKERQIWKLFNPKMTEEELNKKMVDKK